MCESKSTTEEVQVPRPHGLIWIILVDHILYYILVLNLFAMFAVFVPFFLPISLMFRIYRTILIYMIQIKYRGKVSMVAPDDAVWLQDAPKNRAIINNLMQLKGKPDVQNLRNKLLETWVYSKIDDLLRFPKLTSYTTRTWSQDVWITDGKFDVKNHIFMYDGEMPKNGKDLREIIGILISKPFPEKQAAWQIIIIPPIPEMADDSYHLVFRVHHSIADGVSLVKVVMEHVVDETPKYLSPKRFGTRGKFLHAIKGLLLGPYLMVRSIFIPHETHCLHKDNMSGDKLVAWSKAIDLGLIKKIKNALHATVNDVLMGCLAGAFRDHLIKFSSVMPKEIIASIPVDTRSPSEEPVLDNHFSLVMMQLPVYIEDSLQRLEEVKRRMNQMKSSPEALVNALVIKYSMSRLPKWWTRFVFDWISDKCTMVLSNVPGPQQELSINGDAVIDMTCWPPQRKNIGIGISIFSYNGHVRIGIMTDKEVLSDPGIIADKFEEQVYGLANRLKLD